MSYDDEFIVSIFSITSNLKNDKLCKGTFQKERLFFFSSFIWVTSVYFNSKMHSSIDMWYISVAKVIITSLMFDVTRETSKSTYAVCWIIANAF